MESGEWFSEFGFAEFREEWSPPLAESLGRNSPEANFNWLDVIAVEYMDGAAYISYGLNKLWLK